MSNLPNFPILRPSLLLDFANSKQVDPRITFTRASTASYYDAQGVLRTAASGVPRIDFDPVTGECKGLLIEEARTNRCPSSADIGFGGWGNGTNIQVLGRSIAPDGTITATVFGYLGAGHAFSIILVPVSAGETVTVSAYLRLKAGTLQSGIGASLIVDDALDVRTSLYTGVEGTPVLDGTWRRHSITITNGNTAGTLRFYVAADFAPGTEIEVWGAQIEAGASPTSYIPTSTAATTRAADVASMTGTNFSEWYRQDEGTLVVVADFSATTTDSSTRLIFAAGDSVSFNETMYLYRSSSAATVVPVIVDGGVSQLIDTSLMSASVGVAFGAALAYKLNDFGGSANGGGLFTDSSVTVPTVNSLALGCASWVAGHFLNGHIQRLAYYPKRLTNLELQSLSAQ